MADPALPKGIYPVLMFAQPVPPLATGSIVAPTSEARSTDVPKVAMIDGETVPTTVKAEHETPVVQEADEVATSWKPLTPEP